MPLLRADLSQIMDKYVGETEKHLGRLFRSARENHCVLLFDEAVTPGKLAGCALVMAGVALFAAEEGRS